MQDSTIRESLRWLNLTNNTATTIWSNFESHDGSSIGGSTFDANGSQLAFMVQEREGTKLQTTVWYYKSDWIKLSEWSMRILKEFPLIG